ncbi:neurofilament protein H, form H2 [Stagonosporopsis vannaccii]|nr:neurofilament protein H, form H2 [Stagonosporopsis vannaccii]
MAELAVFDKDPNIYLFTSLTAGSSHIVTATSRIETILRANKIPFIGLDTATHELGRKLFQRRAAGKKLPLLVKEGYVLGGIEEIEEWNEYDELHEALGVDTAFTANPPKPTSLFEPAPSKTPPPLADALPGGFSFGQSAGPAFGSLVGAASKSKENTPVASSEQNLAIRQMGAEAAKIAASKKPTPVKISTTNPLLTEKVNASSPADVLSPKSTPLPKSPSTTITEKSEDGPKKTDLSKPLSPRSIPLPETPGLAPKLQQQKPVHAPPSMHDDAENSALSAGPIKSTQAKKESSEEQEEDSSEEASSEGSSLGKTAEKTQDQDVKDASKPGASVREGEQEAVGSGEKSEAFAEVDTEGKVEAETKAVKTKIADSKNASPAPQQKQTSSEETSEEDESSEAEEKKENHEAEAKTDDTKKPQTEEAKDASKAGESVLD